MSLNAEPQIVTFGCRLNTYESEVMRQHAQAAGLDNTIIVNTCAVTAEAERQARQTIRKLRKENPDAKIIVTGCAVQIDPDKWQKMPEINHLVGNQEKLLPQTYQTLHGQEPQLLVNDIMSAQETAHFMVDHFAERARAFIQVQQGCDHRCTFCIIPYGRGPSRSVPMGAIVDQVKLLVGQGYNEIVLTGVDITSYGPDLPGQPTLGQMVKRLLACVPELPRLRISSLDPAEVDADLLWVIEHEPRLLPYLHISLQAGDDMVLKRMKRRHLRQDAINFCQKVRALRPDMVFGADIIAGFPTETDEMFDQTLAIIDECDLLWLHVFPYSEREGTPASRMPSVPKPVRKERAARLRLKGKERLSTYFATRQGYQVEVLMEQDDKGRCPDFAPIKIAGSWQPGDLIMAQIIGYDSENDCLIGKALS